MKALVTGGAGFIGSHLTELLLQEGHEVIIVDNLKSGRTENLKGIQNHQRFCFKCVDIRDKNLLFPLLEGVDWIFHLAGLADTIPSIEHPRDYYEVNVTGTFNVLEAAVKASVKKLVYAASCSCYGIPDEIPTTENAPICPQFPYALTKHLGEELVLHWEKVYQLPSISLRLFNVFGPRSRTTGTYGAVFGIFLAQKLHQKPFTVVGDGNQARDFVFVTDVARAFYQAALSSHTGEIFNVGSSNHHSINELVKLLGGEVTYIPKRPGEPIRTIANIDKIRSYLQWEPKISFKEGVQILLNHLDDFKDAPVWDPDGIKKATKSWFMHLQKNPLGSDVAKF